MLCQGQDRNISSNRLVCTRHVNVWSVCLQCYQFMHIVIVVGKSRSVSWPDGMQSWLALTLPRFQGLLEVSKMNSNLTTRNPHSTMMYRYKTHRTSQSSYLHVFPYSPHLIPTSFPNAGSHVVPRSHACKCQSSFLFRSREKKKISPTQRNRQ